MGQRGQRPACPIDQLIAEYESGMSGRELAKKYGVSHQAIYQRLANAGYTADKWYCRGGNQGGERIALPSDEIIARYQAGESIESLMRSYRVGVSAIYYRLRKYGVKTRPPLAAKVTDDQIRADYLAGLNGRQIAKKHGIARTNAYRRLWRMGLYKYNRRNSNGTRKDHVDAGTGR